jgi:hypothetical protein
LILTEKSNFLANNTGLIPNQPEVASIEVGAACAAPTSIDATSYQNGMSFSWITTEKFLHNLSPASQFLIKINVSILRLRSHMWCVVLDVQASLGFTVSPCDRG